MKGYTVVGDVSGIVKKQCESSKEIPKTTHMNDDVKMFTTAKNISTKTGIYPYLNFTDI